MFTSVKEKVKLMIFMGQVLNFNCGVKFCSGECVDKWNKYYLKTKGNSGMAKTATDLFLTIQNGEICKSLDNYSQK